MNARKKWWGGFVDGKLDIERSLTHGGYGDEHILRPAIFSNKKDARREYQDVRPIVITEAQKRGHEAAPPHHARLKAFAVEAENERTGGETNMNWSKCKLTYDGIGRIVDADDKVVAFLAAHLQDDGEHFELGPLLAAAPKLYEALVVARDTIAAIRVHPANPWKDQDGGFPVEAICDAALAAARGETE